MPPKTAVESTVFKAIFTQRSSLYPQYAILLGTASKETNIADLSEILWRLLPTAETVVIFSQKTRYRAGNWSITPHTAPFTRCFLRRRMYYLWGSTPAQNHQLPSYDYAVAQGIFRITYQRHQRSTMHIGKESAASGAQRNPSTAKVHNLSCKIAPRDSSFTATEDSCNQAQADPPTRSPNRIFHKKNAFIGVFFVHAQHLAIDPFSKHNPTQRSSSKRGFNKQRIKSLGQRDLNTRARGFFRKCKRPYQTDLYPYLPSRSLSILLISTIHK